MITVLAGIAACFAVLAVLLSAEDPFFVLRGVEEGETAVFQHQRYEMAGLIRHQDYESVLLGTSLAANYRASWFAEDTGEKTLKITFPDGWISEFDTALDLAFRVKGGLSTVWFSLDPNILVRSDSQRTVDLPSYLYNNSVLDDAQYWLSADTCELALQNRLPTAKKVTLDEAYIWDGEHTFAWSWALAGYPRPEVSGTALPENAYLAAAEENLDVICGWAEAHPDTEFVIWFPPYSMLYWDKTLREGTADAILAALEYSAQRLSGYDNITLYSFLDDYATVCNLNYYTDHVHCSGQVTQAVAQAVMSGAAGLSPREATERMEALGQYVHSFDFTIFFPV